MIRSIVAVLSGYVAMAVCVMASTVLAAVILLGGIDPSMTPTPAYLTANLIGSLLSAIVGGYVVAWIAVRSKMGHVWILAAIVAVLSAVMLFTSGSTSSGQPSWYPFVILVIGPVGIVTGGKLRREKR